MHRSSPLALAVFVLPFLPDGAPSATAIRFAPEEGHAVTKAFETKGRLEATEVEISIQGDPDAPEVTLSAEWVRDVTVSDVYAACADGRPTKLERTFDSLSHEAQTDLEVVAGGEVAVDEADGSASGGSALEGEAVTFTWDAEAGEYRRAFADGEGDVDLLEGLVEDMDLRAFLPAGEVDEGDSWDVDAAGVLALLAPGGELSFEIESDGSAWEPAAAGLEPWFYTDLAGLLSDEGELQVTCTFTGTREDGDERVAVIELELEISCERDLIDAMQDRLDGVADMLPGAVEVTLADLTLELEGDGELLWNLAANCVQGFELELETKMALDRAIEVDAGGESLEVTTVLAIEGEVKHSLSTR